MELDALDTILVQNKSMSQQINAITQHLSGMEVSAINAQDTSYNMSGGFTQGENYEYGQFIPEQKTRASLKDLEVQMSQLATKVAEIDQRSTNTLPSNTIPNPREECKVISLVSGLVIGEEAQVTEEPVEEEAPEKAEDAVAHSPLRHLENPFPIDLKKHLVLPKAPEYKLKMPYPQRLQKNTKDKQFLKFLEELLFKKRTLKGDETVVLTKKCSSIIQSNLPRKMPDPGSFQISCTIGSTTFKKVLCDLGTSINLMSLSVMKK
ncbi:uncharacterized protein LOC127741520 [Arachis duranensis]|uniref:Uncharacterized protein LOC127741520 n=1 Tax=Arachis duranensis TaxID=130453 RepID=A0A9C6WQ33_ARADU|nr:uncharacterized protein LOC127741520 [Arachis duranensis]